MGLEETIIPWLDKARDLIMKGAEFIGRAVEVDASNLYTFFIIIISIYGSKKILEFFYTTLDGRKMYWAILTIVIYLILKSFGVS